MRNEFTTEAGTPIYWRVTYSLGGTHPFTNNIEPRGYSVSLHRSRNKFAGFSSLDEPHGAVRIFLLEVGRQSMKRETEAMNMISDEYLQNIANRYGI